MSLMDAAEDLTPSAVAANENLRKSALTAALDQELKLFKSCISKAVSSPCMSQMSALLLQVILTCSSSISGLP